MRVKMAPSVWGQPHRMVGAQRRSALVQAVVTLGFRLEAHAQITL